MTSDARTDRASWEGLRTSGDLNALAVTAVALGDVAVYWFRRACLIWEPLWRFRAVHHSSEHLDFGTARREHPLDELGTQLSVNLPVFVMGFPLQERRRGSDVRRPTTRRLAHLVQPDRPNEVGPGERHELPTLRADTGGGETPLTGRLRPDDDLARLLALTQERAVEARRPGDVGCSGARMVSWNEENFDVHP